MKSCVSCFYLTYCMECVWKSWLWISIFQRATERPRILLTDNIQSRGCCSESSITSKCLTNNIILIPCGCGWLHQRAQIIMLIGWGHTWGPNYFQFSYLNGQHEILNFCRGHDCHPRVQCNGICRNICVLYKNLPEKLTSTCHTG